MGQMGWMNRVRMDTGRVSPTRHLLLATRLFLNDLLIDCFCHNFCQRGDVKLFIYFFNMGSHGFIADAKVGSDHFITEPVYEAGQYFFFA